MARPETTTRDEITERYFDDHVPEYSPERLAFATAQIRERAKQGASLVDLGAGAGNTLAYLREQAPLGDCLAVDVSANLLEKAKQHAGCETFAGSLMDPDLPDKLGRSFDFAVVAAVLHHLIGRSRRESRDLARQAVDIALNTLVPGGHLIVVEPVFAPRLAMDGVFWLKKAFSQVSSRRLTFGDYWNNLGVPVVSYYSNEELEEIVTRGGRAEIVARDIEPATPPGLGGILSKTNTTLVIRRLD